MVKNVLLVLSPQDAGLRNELADRLWTVPGTRVEVATNRQKAKEHLTEMHGGAGFDLVVVGASLASDSNGAVADDGGLRCCKAIRLRSQAQILLLVPELTNDISTACAEIADPRPIPIKVTDRIADTVADRLCNQQLPGRRLDVSIIAEKGSWRYELRGIEFAFKKDGDLTVSSSALKLWTQLRYGCEQWYADFSTIGEDIMTCFCDNRDNLVFRAHLNEGMEKAGGPDHARVSFVVERSHYELVLEAIFNPFQLAPQQWMFHAPLSRQIKIGRPAAELFERPARPLRCLVVCADTSGTVRIPDGKTLQLRPLTRIHEECQAIGKLLRREQARDDRVAIDKIQVLGGDGQPPVTKDRLMDVLRTGQRWDLVHFAGHSHFEPSNDDGVGRAFLFAGAQGSPELLEFQSLSPALREAKFLYLSSCKSSSSGFAVEATRAGVSAVVGYRWEVEDKAAKVQAKLFYQELMRSLSVDTAFWKARRRFHHFCPLRDTWASAMLVTAHQ